VAVFVVGSALTPSAAAYTPNDPLVGQQTYLRTIRAFPWPALPPLAPVKVAIVDGAVDGANPDLAGKIVSARSWSGRSPLIAVTAHATAIAGLLAAQVDNEVGIAGISPSAQLIVADVSAPDDPNVFPVTSISAAVRWAADRGARVISISLAHAAYDAREQAAVDYAYRKGAVVVAASGNCWTGLNVGCRTAQRLYPSSLRHVIGVGALASGTPLGVADFSVRDRRFVDLAAPGELVTTLWPLSLPGYTYPTDCAFVGTTGCWRVDSERAGLWGPSGTSYAAPMVAAAASLLFATKPTLSNAQVLKLLEQSAVDIGPPGRDGASGSGALDIAAALASVTG
jgi:subtilisin family serine protease